MFLPPDGSRCRNEEHTSTYHPAGVSLNSLSVYKHCTSNEVTKRSNGSSAKLHLNITRKNLRLPT